MAEAILQTPSSLCQTSHYEVTNTKGINIQKTTTRLHQVRKLEFDIPVA